MIEAIKFALRYDPSPNPRVGAVLVDKNNKIKKITAHKEKIRTMLNIIYLKIQILQKMILYMLH